MADQPTVQVVAGSTTKKPFLSGTYALFAGFFSLVATLALALILLGNLLQVDLRQPGSGHALGVVGALALFYALSQGLAAMTRPATRLGGALFDVFLSILPLIVIAIALYTHLVEGRALTAYQWWVMGLSTGAVLIDALFLYTTLRFLLYATEFVRST